MTERNQQTQPKLITFVFLKSNTRVYLSLFVFCCCVLSSGVISGHFRKFLAQTLSEQCPALLSGAPPAAENEGTTLSTVQIAARLTVKLVAKQK